MLTIKDIGIHQWSIRSAKQLAFAKYFNCALSVTNANAERIYFVKIEPTFFHLSKLQCAGLVQVNTYFLSLGIYVEAL